MRPCVQIALLCAVTNQVLRNVALDKKSYQISTYTDNYGPHPPTLANDGSRQTNYRMILNGCARSQRETNPWWAVDLKHPTVVARVDLTNRGDTYGRSKFYTLRVAYVTFLVKCAFAEYLLSLFEQIETIRVQHKSY